MRVGCVKCIEEGKGYGSIDPEKEKCYAFNNRIYCEAHKPEGAKRLVVKKGRYKTELVFASKE
jgi:hypothetical protein